uniref:60S RIBOSOMAL PROTEIN L5 n=1 Tax=Anncaliia algerae TaxID=723287 RepID=E3PYD7_9MICR|nr:60S RIBOSOMAL PROTEIN L5 [Anncaliia algerae]
MAIRTSKKAANVINGVKTKKYLSRFQTKLRRRREGKTDYKHRSAMIRQDANKQGAVKNRIVVRITNKKIICQVVKAYVVGDRTIVSADSTELKKYGINFGLTNYSAAYATGLLLARRMLAKQNLAEEFPAKEADGEYNVVECNEEGKKPLTCYLDIGLNRSTKGARVFAAMKGCSDGGLRVPHSPDKFAGFSDGKLNSEVLRNQIFGKNVADYMKLLMENDTVKYKKQFSDYIKKGINPEDLEGIYEKAFIQIISDPSRDDKVQKDYSSFARYKVKKLTLEERKARILAKKQAMSAEQNN